MKSRVAYVAVIASILFVLSAAAQITVSLPGRTLNKLVPDYARPRVYGLNAANGSVPGTVLALNATNGGILAEIPVGLNPTDMAMTPAGDALYVINTGGRTISKVDLASFSVVADVPITTPNTYSLANALHVGVGTGNVVYFTDGAWAPNVYVFDYAGGSNLSSYNDGNGVGGMVLTHSGRTMYTWMQYGWSAGLANSYIRRVDAQNNALNGLETGPSEARDPIDSPIMLDAPELRVFNKQQVVSATNVSVLLTQFAENVYAISYDGSLAFGPTKVFNAYSGALMTNFSFSSTVQAVSGDQKQLFRWNASATNLVVFDMGPLGTVTAPAVTPTPADGAAVAVAPANLSWSGSPIALAYDVYFGTDPVAVAAATPTSPQYLGRVANPTLGLGLSLLPTTPYYWRVDIIGFSSTSPGPVWSFTVSPLSVTPQQIAVNAISGFNPPAATLTLSSAGALAWTAAVTGSNWLSLNPTSGVSAGTVTVNFSTAALAVGTATNNIEITVGALKIEVPVVVTIKGLNITKMIVDRQQPFIYALQPPTLTGQNGQLLFISTTNGLIVNTLPIGINPTDACVNYGERRLYIASWTENAVYVVDLATQTLLPSLHLGTDIFKINAGRAGRIYTEGEDQWVGFGIVDTGTGTDVYSSSYVWREGDGEVDPSGTVYYHCDNNISNAHVHKCMVTNDTPVEVAASAQHAYGTRNLVLSGDGNRLFWNSYLYDTNLNELGTFSAEIYSCSGDGRVAFGSASAFDSTTRLAVFNLPVSTTVSTVDGQNQRFWYFNSTAATIGSVPMSLILSPSITQQPVTNTLVMNGGSVYLSTTAMGIAPLAYQWTCYGTNVVGATNYFLSMPSIQLAQQGDYRVLVTNPNGAVTSTLAHVTVVFPPAIAGQLQGTNVLAGQTINLAVTPGGTPPFAYRWIFETNVLSGATNAALTITNAQAVNEGIYRVVVTNIAGAVTSAPVLVRVDPSAPVIVANPTSLALAASATAVFGVAALGSQPLGYQWYFNGLPVIRGTAAQLTLAAIQATNNGPYLVVVSNSLGMVTSAVATLTVNGQAPYFTTQPTNAAVAVGSNRTLTGLADGTQPIAYQWQRGGNPISGATQTSLTLTNLAMGDSGAYALVASNAVGITFSTPAQITVYQVPTLVQPLTNIVVDFTGTAVLAVNVQASPAPAFVWQFNGQPIAGSGPSLVLSNIQPAQSGYYRVTITNQYGSLSSTSRVSVLGWSAQVAAWGDNSGGQTNVPAGLRDIVAIAGGDYHTLALHHDGTLLAWGYNGDGQANVPTNAQRFVAVAAGAAHNLALVQNGSLVAWGRNEANQCTIPAVTSNAVLAVAAGDAHSLALLSAGTVSAWGDNSFGQTTIPTGLNGVRAIAAGRNHNLALRTNGAVVAWGFNTFGQATPPALTNAAAIAAGYLHSVALLSNGTVVAWGDNTFGQTNQPPGLTNILALAAGDFHTLALRNDGRLFAWGDNTYGQLAFPATLTNATAVACGDFQGLALVPVPANLLISRDSGPIVIRWIGPGILQWAPTPSGPYNDVATQSMPYTNLDLSLPMKSFRLRR